MLSFARFPISKTLRSAKPTGDLTRLAFLTSRTTSLCTAKSEWHALELFGKLFLKLFLVGSGNADSPTTLPWTVTVLIKTTGKVFLGPGWKGGTKEWLSGREVYLGLECLS